MRLQSSGLLDNNSPYSNSPYQQMWHDFERLGAHVALAVPVFFARVMLSKVHISWH